MVSVTDFGDEGKARGRADTTCGPLANLTAQSVARSNNNVGMRAFAGAAFEMRRRSKPSIPQSDDELGRRRHRNRSRTIPQGASRYIAGAGASAGMSAATKKPGTRPGSEDFKATALLLRGVRVRRGGFRRVMSAPIALCHHRPKAMCLGARLRHGRIIATKAVVLSNHPGVRVAVVMGARGAGYRHCVLHHPPASPATRMEYF